MSATSIIVSVAVVAVIIGVIAYTRSYRKRGVDEMHANGVKVQGRVVDVDKRRQMISGEIQQYATRTFEVVEFTTADGRAITAPASNASKSPRLNQSVTVFYDPADPRQFVVD